MLGLKLEPSVLYVTLEEELVVLCECKSDFCFCNYERGTSVKCW